MPWQDKPVIRSYSGVPARGPHDYEEYGYRVPSASVQKVRPIVGLDLGQVSDPSALAKMESFKTGDEEPHFQCTYLHRWPTGTPYPKIVEGVSRMFAGDAFKEQGKERPILAIDATGVGRPIADMFDVARIPARFMPIVITGGHKVNIESRTYYVPKRLLVSTVQRAVQERRFQFAGQLPEAPTLFKEMQDFQLSLTENANDTYEGRKGTHDDLLLAVAIALYAGTNPPYGWTEEELRGSWGFRTY